MHGAKFTYKNVREVHDKGKMRRPWILGRSCAWVSFKDSACPASVWQREEQGPWVWGEHEQSSSEGPECLSRREEDGSSKGAVRRNLGEVEQMTLKICRAPPPHSPLPPQRRCYVMPSRRKVADLCLGGGWHPLLLNLCHLCGLSRWCVSWRFCPVPVRFRRMHTEGHSRQIFHVFPLACRVRAAEPEGTAF